MKERLINNKIGFKNIVSIIGIDKFIHKNLYQAQFFYSKGIRIHVLLKKGQGFYIVNHESFTVSFLTGTYILPIIQVGIYLMQNRARLHHVEVYCGSSLSMFYVLMAKLLRIKVLVVERGDLYYSIRKEYNWKTRLSMFMSYKLADRIWYKELYMEPYFNKIGISNKFLLPNAVPVPEVIKKTKREIDFLWINTLKDWRHPMWFAENIFRLRQNMPFKVMILGFLGNNASPIVQELEEKVRRRLTDLRDIVLMDFTDPSEYFCKAKFFVLPEDILVWNYALLEAMSYGVVPIVSNPEGVNHIVENNKNGILAGHSQEGLMQGMQQAMQMKTETWEALSKAARQTVIDKYSITAWGNTLLREYEALGPIWR